jgi:hypothetical protein
MCSSSRVHWVTIMKLGKRNFQGKHQVCDGDVCHWQTKRDELKYQIFYVNIRHYHSTCGEKVSELWWGKRCEESVGTAMESFVTGRQAWWRKCRNCVGVICQLESSVMKKFRDFEGNVFQWETKRNEEIGWTVQHVFVTGRSDVVNRIVGTMMEISDFRWRRVVKKMSDIWGRNVSLDEKVWWRSCWNYNGDTWHWVTTYWSS